METFNPLDRALAYGFNTEEAYYEDQYKQSIEDQERVIDLDYYRTDKSQVQSG